MKLTDNNLARLTVQKKTIIVDESLPALGLRVTPGGTRSFLYRKWDKSRRTWITQTLGRFPALTTEQARLKVIEILQQNYKRVNSEGCTLSVLEGFDNWHDIMKGQNISESWLYTIGLTREHLRPIHHMKLADIKRADVLKLQAYIYNRDGAANPKAKANRGRTANRTVQILARLLQHYELSPAPAQVKRYRETAKESFLEPDDLRKLLEYARLCPDIGARIFLVALFTGARKADVLGMRWDQIQKDAWTIPTTKNGRPLTVYLSRPVLSVLRERKNSSPWVFPSDANALQHWHDYRKPFRRLAEGARVRHFTMHELRHTFATYAVAAGISPGIVSQMLGHTSGGDSRLSSGAARVTMQVYAHALPNAVRDGFNKTAEFIEGI